MHTFEITIQRRQGDSFPIITEEHRDGGQLPVRVEGELRIDENELLAIEVDATAYGRALGAALFVGPVRDAFVEALARSDDLLRVLLFIEDVAVRGLRWERLFAPIDGDWKLLATFQRAPFSRYMPSLTDRRFPPIGRRDLRALILAASPAPQNRFQLEPFDVAAATAGVRAALGPIPTTLLADLDGADGRPTLDALCAAITDQPATILHIVCHGRALKDGESVLFLAGEAPGSVDPVTATRLLERLSSLESARGLPHFAFLSTCESASPDADEAMGGLGQRLVRDLGMPAVVAMTDKVSIVTANALSAEVYARLREHGEPDRALVEGSVRLAERGDVMVPVLFSRLGGRPLFSDTLDRALTPAELEAGLDSLGKLLPARAPVLADELARVGGVLRRSLGRELEKLSPEARQERAEAMATVESLCAEATDLSFQGLCLGEEPPTYDARCPFPGLRSFKADAKEFFFGREPLVQKLLRRIGEHPFLAVLGPSGSGKSSVIFAGLAPALQKAEPGLRVISFTPGERPQASLAAALAQTDGGARALLVADQFEEAFTLCQDADERQAFFAALLQLPERHMVIITMRADFLGEVAPYAALRELVTAHQELIAPMTPEELRRAMELQAAAVGLRFEADLGGQILDDVRDEPGAMPLLQHALQELWQRRRGRWLRGAEYRAIGGIQQAIAHSADQIYDSALPEDKERLRAIFVRLTRLDSEQGEGQPRDTRQRVAMAELVPAGADPAPTRALVGRLADARLLVTGVGPAVGETAEVAHEALIRSWPRLRTWLTEDRQGLLLREAIRAAAREWAAGANDEAFLFRGARLDEAAALAKQPRFALNTQEQQFLDAALALREREIAEREAVRQRELKAAQDLAAEQEQRAQAERLRAEEAHAAAAKLRQRAIYLAGAAGVAVVAAIAAVLFLVQASEQRAEAVAAQATAVENDRQAQSARATAISNQETAVAERDRANVAEDSATKNAKIALDNGLDAAAQEAITSGNNSLAIRLNQEHFKQNPTDNKALRNLAEAAYAPGIRGQINLTKIKDVNTNNWVSTIALSPDGKLAATGHYSGTLAIWNIENNSLVLEQPAGGSQVLAVAFSPSGDNFIVSRADGSLSLGGLSSSKALPDDKSGTAYALAFSPDGRLLATGHSDGKIVIWDVASLTPSGAELDADATLSNVTALAFSPNGQELLAGYDDGVPRLWDMASRKQLVAFDGFGDNSNNSQIFHNGAITSVAFALNGAIAITGSTDKTIGIWNAQGRSPIVVNFIKGHTAAVRSVEVSQDSLQILSASDDGTLRIWSLFSQRELLSLNADEFGVMGAHYLPKSNNARAVSFGNSQPPRIWDLNDGRQESRLLIAAKAKGLSLSADGTLAVAPTRDGAVTINVATNQIAREFAVPNAPLPGSGVAAITPQGDLAASATLSGTILLWNPRSGQQGRELDGKGAGITSLAFSPDGTQLAATTDFATLEIWNIASGTSKSIELVSPFDETAPAYATAIAWSPDGKSLLLGTNWGAWIWDVEKGAISTSFSWIYRGVLAVAFSHDGKLVALGSEDGSAYVADVATGEYKASLKHRGPVRAVAWSRDDTAVVTAADDQRISFWDTANFEETEHITIPNSSVNAITILSDNSMITSSDDDIVRVWVLNENKQLAGWIAANRYVPDLSCGDLARYGLCDQSEQAATPTP